MEAGSLAKRAGEPDFKARSATAAPVPAGDQALQACGETELIDIGRTQPEQRAAQRLRHVGRGARNAVAFGSKAGQSCIAL